MIKREVILVGKLYDLLRVSSGFHTVTCIREHRCVDIAVQNALRGGKHAFHLVVYNTVVGDLIFRTLKLVVPALLHENLFFFSDIRMEDRVHVYVHKVLEIGLIAACNRINRLIRVGHSV